MTTLIVLLIVTPLVAMLSCVRAPHQFAATVTAVTGVLSFVLAVAVEVAFLLDLLAAVVVFGVLMRTHARRARSLSTEMLDGLGDSL